MMLRFGDEVVQTDLSCICHCLIIQVVTKTYIQNVYTLKLKMYYLMCLALISIYFTFS